jgi:hypothetical protein
MRSLIQEACQGPVRDAVAEHGAAVGALRESDLRPVVKRDFAAAARAARASVEPAEVERYERYNDKHGAKAAPLPAAGGGAGGAPGNEDDDW